MINRTRVPNGFFAILLIGAAAFTCADLTVTCSRVHPVSLPLMAVCILVSLALLIYFGVSLGCYIYDHYFHREFTRWLLLAALVVVLALYLLLLGRNLVKELADAPQTTWKVIEVLPRYWDHLAGKDGEQVSHYVPRTHEPEPRQDHLADGLGWLAVIVAYALACNLFYRKYRNYLILHRGYDTDNLLDVLLCVVMAVAALAGLVWPIAFAAAGAILLILLLRRLRRLGPLHGLAISLMQPFALLDSCFHQSARSMAYMAPPRFITNHGVEYTGAHVSSRQEATDEAGDAAIRRQLMELYRIHKADEEARQKKDNGQK